MTTFLLSKDKLSKVKGKVFLKTDVPWLKEYYLAETFENEAYKYAYCIYIDLGTEKKLILGGIYEDKPTEFNKKPIAKGNFVGYLKEYSPNNFESLLFVIDAYPINIKALRQDFYYDPSPLFEIMEYILRPSQGIILWHYQLENILQLFFHPSEVIFLRQGLNAQKPEVLDKMKLISLNESLSLADFLSNRMYVFRKYTKSPNIRAAYDLFKWLRF